MGRIGKIKENKTSNNLNNLLGILKVAREETYGDRRPGGTKPGT